VLTGEPIKDPEFHSALMKIWFGKSPADAQLKEALLCKVAATPGSELKAVFARKWRREPAQRAVRLRQVKSCR
jgi:hypothetical protein